MMNWKKTCQTAPNRERKIHIDHEANLQLQDKRLISTPIQQSQNLPQVQRTRVNYKPYHPHHPRKPTTNYQVYQLIKPYLNNEPYHSPPPMKPSDELSGVSTEQILPDLVLEQGGTSYQEVPPCADTTGTEEDLDTAATLLSLGTIQDDTLDKDTENSKLMPIGSQNAPIDAAPELICLDQISVDNAIVGFIRDDEVPNKPDKQKLDSTGVNAENQETKDSKSVTDNSPTVKGALKTKTYALKKKAIIKAEIIQM